MQKLLAVTVVVSSLFFSGCMEVAITGLQTSGDSNQICANPVLQQFVTVTCR